MNKYTAQVLIGRINKLKRETFWIDTLGSLEPTGLNKKRSEDILESAEKGDTVALIMPFSRTGNMASRIINKHFKILEPKSYLEHYKYSINQSINQSIDIYFKLYNNTIFNKG